VGASLLTVLVVSILLAALARRFDVSAPLALVVAGLAASTIPGLHDVVLDPEMILYVILPPLLWSAGTESSYFACVRTSVQSACSRSGCRSQRHSRWDSSLTRPFPSSRWPLR
jgi:hypothetical protein